jgi:hypothetical protein
MRSLDAGSELDTLIGEQVLGWHIEEGATYWPDTERVWRDADGHRMGVVEEWSPSTDWGAAGEIVTHLEQRFRFSLVQEHQAWSGELQGYRAEFTTVMAYGGGAIAPTAPLAICRAALAAVMRP